MFAERFNQALKKSGISAAELSRMLNIPEGTISQYRRGLYEPKQRRLDAIAKALHTTPAFLMGEDEEQSALPPFDNIKPIRIKKFPLLGAIACGEPIYASEEKDAYIAADSDIPADFCLICKGDSMINARIFDGDIVFIRKQEMVNNGEIAAVIIDEEATLKRVYYYPEEGRIILNAENPQYKPLVLSNEQLNSVRILGKAIAFQSNIS